MKLKIYDNKYWIEKKNGMEWGDIKFMLCGKKRKFDFNKI